MQYGCICQVNFRKHRRNRRRSLIVHHENTTFIYICANGSENLLLVTRRRALSHGWQRESHLSHFTSCSWVNYHEWYPARAKQLLQTHSQRGRSRRNERASQSSASPQLALRGMAFRLPGPDACCAHTRHTAARTAAAERHERSPTSAGSQGRHREAADYRAATECSSS